MMNALSASAGGLALKTITSSSLPGDKIQIKLTLNGPAFNPGSFSTDNPARIVFDFPGVVSNLEKKVIPVNTGVVGSIATVEAGGRTRVVVNLSNMIPFETKTEGNHVFLTLMSAGGIAQVATSKTPLHESNSSPIVGKSFKNIDFRRGDAGEGRVIVDLSDSSTIIDVQEEGGKVVVYFHDTNLPEKLARRLDVSDFATAVKTIDTASKGPHVRMAITAVENYDYLSYQTDNRLTLEFKTLTKDEKEALIKKKFNYTGERLSLNFQDIEVRSVLQLLADFTDLNLVASDSVSGNVTLRLNNVPWDQALAIILKTNGLSQRKTGNVILVAPTEEIAAQEKLELEAQQQVKELAPLRAEFIQVNYAKAADLADLLKSEENRLLSPRGNVTIDKRTNILLIKDTAATLEEIRAIVKKLDKPVKQVMIESRIVIAGNKFSRDLGVKMNGQFNLDKTVPAPGGAGNPNFGIDLPLANPAGSLGLIIGNSAKHLLDLELTAMQTEGLGEIVSSPRVITSDQTEATIMQGVEIPYQEATSSGATNVEFKEAVLKLQVTPHITPDDHIMLDLTVNKDSVGEIFNFVPSIDTREVKTTVLVDNGETVVLGGVYESEKSDNVQKVPFFGDIPVIGFLFKQTLKVDDHTELLIFVTPKILKDSLGAN
ncbi:MAG: type IV pilus secretin PilQ [Gammaproteobacteria bacterium]|nr:MAG: type IV pilus secretin PilQ [Gammaproteobacteria bacterium]